LNGARSGQMPSNIWTFNPRVGFTYSTPARDMTFRGGVGLFSGRVPLVWPGGIYTNSGVIIGGVSANNPNIGFKGDINDQYTAADFGYSEKIPSGEIDVVADNFKLPQVLKSTLGLDKQLPWGIKGTVEVSYNKFLQAIDYKRIDLMPSSEMSDGAGSRTIYTKGKFSTFNGVKNPYSYIMLLGNAEGNKGYTYNLLVSFDKQMSRGWSGNLSWSYGDAKALNNGLSSQNLSQWRYVEAVNGRNNLMVSRSSFAQGHRISFYITKKFAEGKFGATSISAYYNGLQGQAFSYLYYHSMVQDYSFYDSYDLIYVPANSSEIVFGVPQGSGFRLATSTESAAQWQALDDYISNNKYLSSRRGEFAERNGARAPWSHLVDLKLQQDFYLMFGSKRHTITVSYDIFNFTNFLNKNWGRNYYVPYNDYTLISFLGYKNPSAGDYTPVYNFSTPKNTPWTINDVPYYNASRWTSQLGLRYSF
jgi:hypothetical protein